MQYTADEQDSCSALTLDVQPQRGNGSENGWRHAVSNFTCCTAAGHSQHPDEFYDVLPLICPTIYEQDFEWILRL